MFIPNFTKRGFAIVQILLAVALGSAIAGGVTAYYSHINKTKTDQLITDSIFVGAENSLAKSNAGITNSINYQVDNATVSITNGKATITNVDSSSCASYASMLGGKGGVVTSSCGNNPTDNRVSFATDKETLTQNNATPVVKGTPDGGASNTLNPTSLNGNVTASGNTPATGSTAGSLTGSGAASVGSSGGLLNGTKGTVISGGAITMPSSGAPTSSQGGAVMSCQYKLVNDSAYKTTSLGQRATPCGFDQASTSNQTGTRTFFCSIPTSASNPTYSDNWTGGSCAPLCHPAAQLTRDVGCPVNQIGNHFQHADSSCPQLTGAPVYGGWYDYAGGNTCAWNTSCVGQPAGTAWNGSTCQLTCNTLRASINPATGSETRAKPSSSCPVAGTAPSGNETRTFSYTCDSTFANPRQVWTGWAGGSCIVVLPKPPQMSTFIIGLWGGYDYTEGTKAGMGKCTAPTQFNSFVLWNLSDGNPADYYDISFSKNGVSISNYRLYKADIQCSASCAHPIPVTVAQGNQLVSASPSIDWSSYVYDHAQNNGGGGITIYPWMADINASINACNASGCTLTTKTVKDFSIFSNGVHDCDAASGGASYPPTAHPPGY